MLEGSGSQSLLRGPTGSVEPGSLEMQILKSQPVLFNQKLSQANWGQQVQISSDKIYQSGGCHVQRGDRR